MPDTDTGIDIELKEQPLAQPWAITAHIPYEEAQKELDAVWKEVSPTIEVKGFRKGQVPRSLAVARLGFEVLYRSFIDDVVEFVLENASIDIIGIRIVNVRPLDEENGFNLDMIVELRPTVELPDYKQLLPIEDTTIKQVTVDQEIVRRQIVNAEDIELPIDQEPDLGDIVVLDLTAKSGKLQIQLEDHHHVIDRDSWLPPHLCTTRGQQQTLSVTPTVFPDERFNLQKTVVTFTIKNVFTKKRPSPEELAVIEGYQSLDAYRASLEHEVRQANQNVQGSLKEMMVLNAIVEQSEMGPIPDIMIHQAANEFLMEASAASNQRNPESYLSSIGKTKEQFLMEVGPQARQRTRVNLVLDKIIEQENIEPSIGETSAYESQVVQRTPNLSIEEFRANVPRSILVQAVKRQKAYDLLMECQGIQKQPRVIDRTVMKPVGEPEQQPN